MSKHTEISQQLRAMEQGRFQIVCIEYLKSNVGGMIHSPGTVDDKEKTKKGHPDIYLIQEDGNYVFAECTTKDNLNASDFNAKLEKDLIECLKFDELQVPQEKIESIYLCCNSSVETSTSERLGNITKAFGIGLKIVGIHELANYFSSAGKVFAKDFMGIAFETGQILNKEDFLTQYQKRNLATPLDNPIFGRENELLVLVKQITHQDLILVNGPAGIGKSRLVIEAVDLFLRSNEEFTSFYIFPKSSEITEDLFTFLKPGKSYILLIDDANRQLNNLIKILEKFVESKVRLKVIMTVRDYAKDEVIKQCGGMKPKGFILAKLNDEIIREIISHEPFLINDGEIGNRIVQISDGNPRLAIMAAEIMKSNPDENILRDVTRIYDAYFENILDDRELLTKKHTRKVLGIISFFYSLDTSVPAEQDIITSFGLSVDEFIECSQELEELEITEIYDQSVVRISEQIVATYFFYNCFFRNAVLDFNLLLTHCHERNIYRLKDSIIPSINTFGEENVIIKMYVEWQSFWNVIKMNDQIALSFMRIFGKYFPNLCFSWLSEFENVSVSNDEEAFNYDNLFKIPNSPNNNEVLNLLETFYSAPIDQFQSAIHLSFEYAAGNAETLAILIDKLRTNLHLNRTEISNGLPKITFVYDFLVTRALSQLKFKYALYLIMDNVILNPSWRNELYNETVDGYVLKDILKKFRSRLLNDYLKDYDSEKTFLRSLLLNYVKEKQHLRYPEIEQDFEDIALIIEKYMSPEDFIDCYFVNKYVALVERKSSSFTTELKGFLGRFKSPTYWLYSILSMRHDYTNDEYTWEEFRLEKTKMISEQISIKSVDDFKNLHNKLIEIFDFRGFQSNAGDGVAILIRNILSTDFELGMECLEIYIKHGNIAFLNGISIMWPILMKGKAASERFYVLMNKYEFFNKNEWINSFFLHLPEDQIDEQIINMLIEFYNAHVGAIEIYGSHYDKYESYQSGSRLSIMRALYNERFIV